MALRDAAIVAYAETKIVDNGDLEVWELAAQVLEQIIVRSGYEKRDLDGLIISTAMTASNSFWSQVAADELGLELDFCQVIDIGGCSPTGAVARAAAAIEGGLCNRVLCLFADTPRPESFRRRPIAEEWTAPIGYLGPTAAFGMLSKRYEHRYGLDFRALGKIAVTQRTHGIMNELACEKLRRPITIDDYLTSRVINDPIRLLDSVMACDGANGVIVTSRKEAETRGFERFVVPVGYGERTNFGAAEAIFEPTETGHAAAGERAFRQAGVGPSDIASVHFYDDFLIALMLQFEMLGFCARGQGCDFINSTDFLFTGDLPLNTGGGQISAGQTGLAGGGTNLVEAVRQLFGEGGKRQVRDTRNALVTGIGGIPYGRNWTSSSVLILTPGS